MGYTTDFSGSFQLDKPLTEAQIAYLKEFEGTRRMKRDVEKMKGKGYRDPIREAVGLPLGTEGEFYVGAGDNNPIRAPKKQKNGFLECAGQAHTPDIIDYNHSPSTQPGLWCQWVPSADGTRIEWDGGEKFYDYVEWLQYLISNFLQPWGYFLNGEVRWQGEDSEDRGKIVVTGNKIRTLRGHTVYQED